MKGSVFLVVFIFSDLDDVCVQDYTVATDAADDIEVDEGDADEDIAEGGGIDLPDTNR